MKQVSLIARVAAHAREHADAVAVAKARLDGGFDETSWTDLRRRAAGWAAYLPSFAAQQPIVPLLAGKSAETIAAMLGACALGRGFSFINPKYRLPQIEAVLSSLAPAACVVDAAGLLALKAADGWAPIVEGTTWLLVGAGELNRGQAEIARALRQRARVVDVPHEFHQAAELDLAAVPAADRAGACLFTSGSTGIPKGVLISEADLLHRADAEVDWFGLSGESVLLSLLPFSFDVGLNQLFTALSVGAELVLLESWLPADILRAAAERRVSGISGVPFLWQSILDSGLRFDTDAVHAQLDYITVSGGSLAPAALARLPEAIPGVRVFKTYGQTEAFRATSLRPEDFARKPASVGRPFTGVKLYVVRDDASLCAPGEIGEVVHTGLGTMMGYLAEAGRPPDPAGKLRLNPFFGADDSAPLAIFTGDFGYLDEEGYLFLKGRQDAMVKIMGNRVYPEEVTKEIAAFPGARDAAVIGATGTNGQSVLAAFVVFADRDASAPAKLRRWLSARLPGFMLPHEIVAVDEIPRGATGKADLRRLAELRPRTGEEGS